jgi:hexosaminidase
VNREDATGASAAILADNETGLKLEQFASGRRMGYTRFGVADYAFDYILPANTWSHVAFVASASGTTLYVDGQLVGSLPDTVKLPLMTIGARPSGVDHLKGLLDEITIFDRALTPLEIRQVRNATDAH